MFCAYDVCPSNVIYCYDTLYCFPPLDFVPRPDHSYLKFFTDTSGDPSFRPPIFQTGWEIWSEELWYGDVPLKKIYADDLKCRTGSWEDHDIPWESAWCVKLTYNCPKAVQLSYAYYWRPRSEPCPYGAFELAWFEHLHGSYPWPHYIMMDPTGTRYGEQAPCPDATAAYFDVPQMAGFWAQLDNLGNWAGLAWYPEGSRLCGAYSDYCAGPAYANLSDIKCCDTGPRAGQWWFQVVVNHIGTPILLEYRKPALELTGGCFGTYFLYDPNRVYPWAPHGVQVWEEELDWHTREPNITWIVCKEIGIFVACWFAGYFLQRGLSHVSSWVSLGAPYSDDALRAATYNSRPALGRLTTGSWRCRAHAMTGSAAAKDKWIALEAIRRLKGLAPIPVPW